MKEITLTQLIAYLHQFLNVENFPDYCPNGLQVQGKETIKKLGFAVSASESTIKQASLENVDVLIVHHGLIWNKESPILNESKIRRLKPLIEKGISLLAYHLPLDAHQEVGNNWKAARDLGWKELSICADIGVKGKISRQPIKDVIAKLESHFEHEAQVALFGKKEVESCAFVSGGGYSYLSQAVLEGVDLFITGNFDEPAWWIAEEEHMNFAALGHFATEQTGIKALKEKLTKELGVETLFISAQNPF